MGVHRSHYLIEKYLTGGLHFSLLRLWNVTLVCLLKGTFCAFYWVKMPKSNNPISNKPSVSLDSWNSCCWIEMDKLKLKLIRY